MERTAKRKIDQPDSGGTVRHRAPAPSPGRGKAVARQKVEAASQIANTGGPTSDGMNTEYTVRERQVTSEELPPVDALHTAPPSVRAVASAGTGTKKHRSVGQCGDTGTQEHVATQCPQCPPAGLVRAASRRVPVRAVSSAAHEPASDAIRREVTPVRNASTQAGGRRGVRAVSETAPHLAEKTTPASTLTGGRSGSTQAGGRRSVRAVGLQRHRIPMRPGDPSTERPPQERKLPIGRNTRKNQSRREKDTQQPLPGTKSVTARTRGLRGRVPPVGDASVRAVCLSVCSGAGSESHAPPQEREERQGTRTAAKRPPRSERRARKGGHRPVYSMRAVAATHTSRLHPRISRRGGIATDNAQTRAGTTPPERHHSQDAPAPLSKRRHSLPKRTQGSSNRPPPRKKRQQRKRSAATSPLQTKNTPKKTKRKKSSG
ncbi:hypothetical protein C8J57DRAFT_1567134 [Mycena rebaudengoi]|nr:hypothetical protein C8J57DRAFT_1567134 [Mycena rebaudengoi]